MELQSLLDYAALGLSPVPIAGDAVGLLADGYRMASDPAERNWLNAGLMAAGALPFVPSMGAIKGAMRAADSVGDGLDLVRTNKHKMAKRNAAGKPWGDKKLTTRNTPEQRAEALGFERGWYRGGGTPETNKLLETAPTGQWYSRSADEAAGYARPDAREYAIRGGLLDLTKEASQKEMATLADFLTVNASNPAQASLARTFKEASMAANEVHQNRGLWQGMEKTFGSDVAAKALDKLDYSGVSNVNNIGDAFITRTNAIRDANLAAFDPAKINRPDIYGRATVPFLLTAGLAGLGGIGALSAYSEK